MSETRPVTSPGSLGISLQAHKALQQSVWIAVVLVQLWVAQLAVARLVSHSNVPFDTALAFVSAALTASIVAGSQSRSLLESLGTTLYGGLFGVLLGISHLLNLVAINGVSGGSALWFPGVLLLPGALGSVLGRVAERLALPAGALTAALATVSCLILTNDMAGRAIGAATLNRWFDAAALALFAGSIALFLGAELARTKLFAPAADAKAQQPDPFRQLADALPMPLIVTTPDHERIIFASEQTRQRLGVLPKAADNRPGTDGLYVDPDARQLISEIMAQQGVIEGQEIELRATDGMTIPALLSARRIMFEDEPAIVAAYFDISERKAAEEALLASEVRYALISRASNDGIWDWDLQSGEVYYSARWREIVGAPPGKRLFRIEDWFDRVHEDDLTALRYTIDDHMSGLTPHLDVEYRLWHGEGHICWMQCRGIVLRNSDGAPIRLAGSQADITLRKSYEINLRNAAYEDRLTGISNRAFFTQLVESHKSPAAISSNAILLINVDQFRRVNDSLGTAAGDALLIAVTKRLAANVKPEDALARIGADEFAIWLAAATDQDAVLAFAETLRKELTAAYELGEAHVVVTTSAGIALPALGDARSGSDLVHNARLALDRAKSMGGDDWVLFDEALLSQTKLHQRLSRDLIAAGRLGQIYFDYQPVFALSTNGDNQVSGFEALMRWNHPELGAIPPAQFIPIAEEAGLIGNLGLLAIEHAAIELEDWLESGVCPEKLYVAVNLSLRQVSDPNGVQRLLDLLDRLRLPPGRLHLEITESVLMSNPDSLAVITHELRERGVELSLDDFGTGYSSLSYLHRFPLSTLKIDRSFIVRMLESPEALRLVRSIIDLGHDLGFTLVGEGIETAEQLECLRELGCDYGQGYYFSRPISREAAVNLLRGQNRRKTA